MLRRLLLVGVLLLVWTPAAFAWSWPVGGPVLQPFAYDASHPYAAGQHRGIDVGAGSAGDPVAAPAGGTVAFAGSVPTSGKCVTIETADGYSVTLTHLGSIDVEKGATVAEGDVVGTVGPSGIPELDGPYVHLGIRLTANPLGYVDPLGLLPALAPPTPPVPAVDPGSAGSSAPGITAPPPAPPVPTAPTASTAPPPDEPAVPAYPAPATSTPEPAQAAPTASTGDSKPVAGSGKPVPAPPVSTGSNDFADLPAAADGATGAEAAGDDGADSGSPEKATSPAGNPGATVAGTASQHERLRDGSSPEVPLTLPARREKPSMGVGRRPQRSPVSASSSGQSEGAAATSRLSLALGLGPGLVAVVAALTAALVRLRRRTVAAAGGVVIRLPGRRFEQPRGRRAA